MKRKRKIALLLVMALVISLVPMANAYALDAEDIEIYRYGGANRYATSIAIADEYVDYVDGVDTVVIASGSGFADALAAGPLAYELDAPILLSAPTGLTKEVLDKIKDIAPKNAYLIGGTGAVPTIVENQLRNIGISTSNIYRIAGEDRYLTAAAIARKLADLRGDYSYNVFLVYGLNYPDALSISSVASRRGYPILYVAGNYMPEATSSYLFGSDHSRVVAIGGPTLISDGVLYDAAFLIAGSSHRIYGKNRYETSAKIAYEYADVYTNIAAATGTNFPDALAGSVLAARKRSAILLVNDSYIDPATRWANRYFLKEYINVFGGTGVVSDETLIKLYDLPAVTGEPLEIQLLEPLPRQITENGITIEVTDYDYTYSQNASGTYNGVMRFKITRLSGTNSAAIKVSLYDVDNNRSMRGTESTYIPSGTEGFTNWVHVEFSNLPKGVYEIYIFDNVIVE